MDALLAVFDLLSFFLWQMSAKSGGAASAA